MHRSGETINVKSEEGKGTTFDLFLPIPTKNAKTQLENRKIKPSVEGSGTVLIVDDEKPLTKLFSIELSKLGYTALIANSWVEAKDILSKKQLIIY